jgi:hypothetical protein
MAVRTLEWRALVIISAAVCLSGAAWSAERLSLRVSPAIAVAPADLVVRTVVEASPANRAIEVVAESSDFYRSSEMPLDGERAARVARFRFRSLPAGAYVVTARLKGTGDELLAETRRQVRVIDGPSAR